LFDGQVALACLTREIAGSQRLLGGLLVKQHRTVVCSSGASVRSTLSFETLTDSSQRATPWYRLSRRAHPPGGSMTESASAPWGNDPAISSTW
jgi:hypothetical protein